MFVISALIIIAVSLGIEGDFDRVTKRHVVFYLIVPIFTLVSLSFGGDFFEYESTIIILAGYALFALVDLMTTHVTKL